MKKRSYFAFELIRVISDLLMINFAFLFSYWFRFNSGAIPVIYGVPPVKDYISPIYLQINSHIQNFYL